jgi:hypothetical protein
MHDARDIANHTMDDARDIASRTMHDARDMVSSAVARVDTDMRDKILLGAAGLAVAAALGVACQKRITEEVS